MRPPAHARGLGIDLFADVGAPNLSARSRKLRRQRLVFATAVATTLNGLGLLSLAIDRRAPVTSSDPIQVYLVPALPRAQRETPRVRPSLRAAAASKAADEDLPSAPWLPTAIPPADSASADPSRAALRSPPDCFGAGPLTAEDRERCAERLGAVPSAPAGPLGLDADKGRMFALQANRKAAIGAYRRSNSARDYPSLRSVFGGRAPLDPEEFTPGEPMTRR